YGWSYLAHVGRPVARLSAAPPSVLPDGRLLRRGWGQAGGWAGCRTPLPLPPRVRQPVRQPVLARSVPQREHGRQHLAPVVERVDAEVIARTVHAVQRRRRSAPLRAATELPVGSPHDDLAECPLREVIVD